MDPVLKYDRHLSEMAGVFFGSGLLMIDFFQPDNFQTLASFIMWTVGGTCLVVCGLASWTLIYIIKISGDMAEANTLVKTIADSLSDFKQENERDHEKFDTRLTKGEDVNQEQWLAIQSLQNGNC